MSDKTLKFGNVIVNKDEFHASEKPIALNLVDIDKIVISGKFKHKEKRSKYFIADLDDNIIISLCFILTQMRGGYIKYFNGGGKNMYSKIKYNNIFFRYNEICKKFRKTLNLKFHSQPI